MSESQSCNIPNLAPSDGFGFVYAISDPINPNVPKYVGKTKNTLRWRLCSHLEEAARFKGDKMKPFFQWINEMIQESRLPKIYALEVCKLENIKDRERHWIKFFKPLGILNRQVPIHIVCVDTGEEFFGYEEASKKIGADASSIAYAIKTNGKCFGKRYKLSGSETLPEKGWSTPKREAARIGLIARNKMPRSLETIRKIIASKTGKKMKPEFRDKMVSTEWFKKNLEIFRAHSEKSKRPVVCVQTGDRYDSISDAAKALNCRTNAVKQSAIKGFKCKGYNWKFEESTKGEIL